MSKCHVVVLGAGVTGLTSAVFLSEAGYTVTVIAAHVPGDKSIEYTSPWYVYSQTLGLRANVLALSKLKKWQGRRSLAYPRHKRHAARM
jgi:glycine/D-amino acid oxidase-like deaminating enzyme